MRVVFDFNSIKVRLEQGVKAELSKTQSNFNSIKVRLELSFNIHNRHQSNRISIP